MMEYTYEYTATLPNGNEADVIFHYTYTPGSPARIRYDENDHPADPPEIDLIRTTLSSDEYGNRLFGEAYARQAATDFDQNEDLRDRLIENARDYDEYRRDEAAEHAAEARREIRREEQ